MNNKDSFYSQNHKLAKSIVCIMVLLINLVGQSIDQSNLAASISTVIWFFGINPVAYLMEALRGHPHQHALV